MTLLNNGSDNSNLVAQVYRMSQKHRPSTAIELVLVAKTKELVIAYRWLTVNFLASKVNITRRSVYSTLH